MYFQLNRHDLSLAVLRSRRVQHEDGSFIEFTFLCMVKKSALQSWLPPLAKQRGEPAGLLDEHQLTLEMHRTTPRTRPEQAWGWVQKSHGCEHPALQCDLLASMPAVP